MMKGNYLEIDQYGNWVPVVLDDPPLIVQRCFIIGRYNVEICGATENEVISSLTYP